MDQHLSYKQAFALVDRLIELCRADTSADAKRHETFGQWVLATLYPDVFVEGLPNGRDFYFARRTADARLYLVGLLRTRALNPQRIESAVQRQVELRSATL